MANLIGILVAMTATLPGRVLTSLGIGWITYAGLSALVSSLTSTVQATWGGMPAAILQLATLGGFTEGFGVILGAMAARVALLTIPHLGKL